MDPFRFSNMPFKRHFNNLMKISYSKRVKSVIFKDQILFSNSVDKFLKIQDLNLIKLNNFSLLINTEFYAFNQNNLIKAF